MIGIFGGSFNPIHTGHLILAEFIREEFNLEKIIFIPAKKPPHKEGEELAPAQHRYNMVLAATAGNPFFDVSGMELNRKGYSYTSETLETLKNQNPNKKLFFICGADSVVNLTTWHNYGKIFYFADVIVAGRAKVSEQDFQNITRWFIDQYNAVIQYSTVPQIEISSTQIRDRIKQGQSVRYMVPECIDDYIQLHRLY